MAFKSEFDDLASKIVHSETPVISGILNVTGVVVHVKVLS